MKKLIVGLLAAAMMVSTVGCSQNTGSSGSDGGVEGYPKKPVEVVIAYKAGGGTDVGGRILASVAEKNFGQPFVIVNRPGSDGELGYTEVAKATPDGYKIGFINLPTFVSLPLERNTQYKVDDVVPILNHVYDPGVLAVQANSKWNTLEDFISDAKADPGDLTISNNGTGASNHIGAAHFEYEAGIDVTHVPFGGSTDMIAALRGGHVDATVAKISEVASLVSSGELKILASFTEERLEDFADIPTLKEKGYDILFGSARGLVAPAGTPQEIIDILHDTFKEAMESQEHIEKAKNADLPIKYMSPEDLKAYMEKEEIYLKDIKGKIDLN